MDRPVIALGSAQIKGSRAEQQDSLAFGDVEDKEFVEHGGVLAVVADGIGGHAHGGEASRRAVAAFMREYQAKPLPESIPSALYHALLQANRAVLAFADSRGETENCGTTLVAAVIHPNTGILHWIGVGDSRLYCLREGQLVQFTADANVGRHHIKKVASGMSSRDGLIWEESWQRLTSFVGKKNLVAIDRSLKPFPLHEGDIAVLCTDGIYQALSEQDLVQCLWHEPQTACLKIIQRIVDKKKQNQDNATVAVLAYGFKQAPQADLVNHYAIVRVKDNNKAKSGRAKGAPINGSIHRWLIAGGVLALAVLLVGIVMILR